MGKNAACLQCRDVIRCDRDVCPAPSQSPLPPSPPRAPSLWAPLPTDGCVCFLTVKQELSAANCCSIGETQGETEEETGGGGAMTLPSARRHATQPRLKDVLLVRLPSAEERRHSDHSQVAACCRRKQRSREDEGGRGAGRGKKRPSCSGSRH